MLGLVTGYMSHCCAATPSAASAAVTRYAPPPDLLTIDMASMYPELKI